jgi:serine phosphatase RsbU (regulator of sigma subunit)
MQYIAYFSKGFIGVASPDETKPETIQLLERFAAVFNLTYTRFNDLKQAEAQNKIIQAENERKTKELEEARQLQLAMLPKSIPEIQNLDIAVYMKTATEVGGDYYDFKVQENGVLNIGIGDATGHGLQAGTMITLMKGFFTSDVARFSPQKFLEHCNSMIRDIKLGRILMSFSHLRFENKRLIISSAGMPPIYYHHKKNNRTEEIIIRGMPLGAMQSSSYKIVEKELNGNDTILLLTDGLPEQMNSNKVIFDYSRVLKYFDEIAENTPDDIIKSFVKKADEWMNGTAQADDITFIVIKVK